LKIERRPAPPIVAAMADQSFVLAAINQGHKKPECPERK
jgi:hypothetical protein